MEGWFFLSAALLLVSGGAKLANPAPTAGALRAAGMFSGNAAVIALAAVEIVTGAASLVGGGAWGGWPLAILYGGFAVFVLLALHRGLPIASCGCFGKVDTPPSVVHLVLNVAAASGGIVAAKTHSPPLLDVLANQPMAGVLYLAFLAFGTYAAYLLLTELPALIKPRRALGNR